MVQLAITLIIAAGTTNAYSQDVEDVLVQYFSSSGLGRQLLHSIYTRVNPGADRDGIHFYGGTAMLNARLRKQALCISIWESLDVAFGFYGASFPSVRTYGTNGLA